MDYQNEDEVNVIVDNYVSTGQDKYKLELMKAFDPYFRKYVNILVSNKSVDISNKDTITFLRLFTTEEERATEASLSFAAKKTIQHIRMVFNDCTPEDIYDEMVLIFLEQLARYKPMIANNTPHKRRISFTHFLQVNTRYKIKNLCALRGKDALHGVYNVEFNDDLISSEEIAYCDGPKSLDHDWVEGSTAGDVFNKLEAYERYLLYLKYSNEQRKPLSDYEIADITGDYRVNIYRKMKKLREKIKGLVEN